MKCLLELDHFPLTWAEKLAYLTVKFLKEDQTACPVEHVFKDGHYIREMRIPKETLFIGRPHRIGHLCELVSGKVLHVTETAKRIVEAPFALTTVPGYQMVLYTMTDIVGRTYHSDAGERDIEKLENTIFESVDSIKALGNDVRRRIKEIEAARLELA